MSHGLSGGKQNAIWDLLSSFHHLKYFWKKAKLIWISAGKKTSGLACTDAPPNVSLAEKWIFVSPLFAFLCNFYKAQKLFSPFYLVTLVEITASLIMVISNLQSLIVITIWLVEISQNNILWMTRSPFLVGKKWICVGKWFPTSYIYFCIFFKYAECCFLSPHQ